MKCLCCGKEIINPSIDEQNSSWHISCTKKFFNSSFFPRISISKDELQNILSKSVQIGGVTGVQKKLSLHLETKGKESRLTLINYPQGYILKPQSNEYRCLPEAEYLTMQMAQVVGIKTVPYGLIRLNSELAYITKRIDRISQNGVSQKIAMEDFCQLDGRQTIDKYKGSYERCSNIIANYSSNARLDMTEFYLRLVFSFVVGNSDMHLKNFSLIQSNNKYILSPAYDLLIVNIVNPLDTEETALTINGKKRNITKNSFYELADYCNLTPIVATRLINSVISKKDKLISLCNESYLPDDLKEKTIELIENRCARLN